MKKLESKGILHALKLFDRLVPESVDFLLGGGGAMIVAYQETEATSDLDMIPLKSKLTFEDLRPYILKVSEELDLPRDWINPYFGSFTGVLPEDYGTRLKSIFEGTKIHCFALGPEDLLVMKLMAGRAKDDRHIRRLLRLRKLDSKIVDAHLERLKSKGIRGASEALDRWDEYRSEFEIS